jgi:hypothetical protein
VAADDAVILNYAAERQRQVGKRDVANVVGD